MFDISIPLSVILLMAPILMPFLSVPGALFAGVGWYRRKKNIFVALVAAVVGAFAAPWATLLVITVVEELTAWSERATPVLIGTAWAVGALSIVGLVLWGASHAGSRRRGGS